MTRPILSMLAALATSAGLLIAGAAPAHAALTQTITFADPGTQTFGTNPTLVASSTSGLTVTFSSATTDVCVVTSGAVTFLTVGECTINADQAGDSTYDPAPQVSRTFTVTAGTPLPPTGVTAISGDGEVSVAFTPGYNGGSSITGYTVTSSPGGLTGTGTSSPLIVTGLTNGTAYTFTATATNNRGTSAPSAPSNSVRPAAPQIITFSNPGAQNFGTSPTLIATSDSGLTVTFSSATTGVCTIAGGTLTFVTAGSCTINADQSGSAAFLPASQVSRTFSVNPIVPGAPTGASATAGDTSASVAFTAPASNGGSPITFYTVTSSPGGVTGTGSRSPIILNGLTNGVAYTFIVEAANAAGTGAPSTASNAITPLSSQTITFANPGTQELGTSPTLTATSDSGLVPTFTSSTSSVCTITSGGALTFVTTGSCTINADQVGSSTYLPATQVTRTFSVIRTAVAADPPVITGITAGNGQALLTWTAPASDGGSPIDRYTVAYDGGSSGSGTLDVTAPATSATITGLANGVEYSVTVTAVNGVGPSRASNTVRVTPVAPAAPSAPSAPSAPATEVVTPAAAVITDVPAPVALPGVLTVTGVVVRPASTRFTYAYDDRSPADAFIVVDEMGAVACSSGADRNTCTTTSDSRTFVAFARNAAGDGPRTTVTVAERTLRIAGERRGEQGRRILIDGTSTGFTAGDRVVAFVKAAGRPEYRRVAARTVGSDGTFSLTRTAAGKARVYVTSADGAVRSNTVTIRR